MEGGVSFTVGFCTCVNALQMPAPCGGDVYVSWRFLVSHDYFGRLDRGSAFYVLDFGTAKPRDSQIDDDEEDEEDQEEQGEG